MADTKPNNTDKAYFAGFFDGEGHVGIYPKRYAVTIANTNRLPLERVMELWGGTITYQDREPNRRIWRWSIYGANSRCFLKDILPYTLNKGPEIEVYLNVIDVIPTKRGERQSPGVGEIVNEAIFLLKNLKRGLA